VKNIKLTLAYDGTHFLGWQNNGQGRSVEFELQRVLKAPLQAASRTDRGVHAKAQVVNFFAEEEPEKDYLNSVLPDDIRVLSVEVADDSFHPSVDVKAKVYRYVLSKVDDPLKRLYSWYYPWITSVGLMREGAAKIIGKHDFLGFSNVHVVEREDTVREIFGIDVVEYSDEIHIVITGDHFLYKMARNIAGTLAYIGSGKLDVSVIDDIFSAKDRTLGGITAPAHGLFLERVSF